MQKNKAEKLKNSKINLNKFKTLFLMQLKERLNLSFLKNKKQLLFKVIFAILGFVVVTAVAYLVLWLCQFLNIFSALNRIPISVMAVVFFVIFVLNLFTCTVGLSKTLFYSKDNQMLVTFPVNGNLIYLSKMLVYYINEIKRTFTFVIPIFFAYGLLSALPFMYFIWMPIMLVIFAAIPVLIGGLLSFPMHYVLKFLRRFPLVKTISALILVGGLVVGAVFLIEAIPENINLIESWTAVSRAMRSFLSWFSDAFYIFYAFTIFLCGKFENLQSVLFTEYSWIVLLIMLAVILVLVGLNYLISRPLYLRSISKQFEFDVKNKKVKHFNIKRNSFVSTSIYESRRLVRDNGVLSTAIATLVITPIAILLLCSIYAAINTRAMGDFFVIGFNILIILLFIMASNIGVSSIYSRDGEAMFLNKTKPQKPYKILFPRLFFNSVISVIILTISAPIFFVNSTLSAGNAILAYFMMLFLILAHILWSAELDFLNPQTVRMRTEGILSGNPNEVKSTILAFALSAVAFGLILFFLMDGGNFVWLKLFFIALALLLLRGWMFYYKSKVLFKEIES